MPILLLVLLVAVLGYMYWQRRTTSLTRNCRWRQTRRSGGWACAYCGACSQEPSAPTHCGQSPGAPR